jgi:hypothetical protein
VGLGHGGQLVGGTWGPLVVGSSGLLVGEWDLGTVSRLDMATIIVWDLGDR